MRLSRCFSRHSNLTRRLPMRQPNSLKLMLPKCYAGSLAPTAGFEQARRAATTAIKLDPKNVTAHATMAWIHMSYDWDWAGAERELQQAATLAPGNVDVLIGKAELSCARSLGRCIEASSRLHSLKTH